MGGYAPASTASAKATVNASLTSVTLLAADPDRLGFIIRNDSTDNLYLGFGEAAATTSVVKLPAGAIYVDDLRCGDLITGLWDGTNGAARIQTFR